MLKFVGYLSVIQQQALLLHSEVKSMMNSEIYYIVGAPNSLKQVLISVLRETLSPDTKAIVPVVFTTDQSIAESENYQFIDERNFLLRQSMGMYSLSWKRKNEQYGIEGDIQQRQHSGCDIIINGSLSNLSVARRLYPEMNIILIRGCQSNQSNYPIIAEDDEVRLEMSTDDLSMGFPFILTVMSLHGMANAVDMLLMLIKYNNLELKKAV